MAPNTVRIIGSQALEVIWMAHGQTQRAAYGTVVKSTVNPDSTGYCSYYIIITVLLLLLVVLLSGYSRVSPESG